MLAKSASAQRRPRRSCARCRSTRWSRSAADYAPFPDGVLMPETPSQALARGRLPDVPLMIGWNSGEDTLMGPSPLPEATLKQIPAIAKHGLSRRKRRRAMKRSRA